MTKRTRQKELEQIKKLLALARDQSGTPEGEHAHSLARKRMKALGISESDFDASEASTEEVVVTVVLLNQHRTLWEQTLLEVAYVLYDCDLATKTIDEAKEHSHIVAIGPKKQVEDLQLQFTSLRQAVMLESSSYARRLKMTAFLSEPLHVYIETFSIYATLALSERILDMISLRPAQPDSTDQGRTEEQQEYDGLEAFDEDLQKEEEQVFMPEETLDHLVEHAHHDNSPYLGNLDPSVLGYEAGLRIMIQTQN
jgi:hypothetical protein